MDKLIFKTKSDINGNRYYLIVDLETKKAQSGYNLGLHADGIEITKKGLRDLRNKLEAAGFMVDYI